MCAICEMLRAGEGVRVIVPDRDVFKMADSILTPLYQSIEIDQGEAMLMIERFKASSGEKNLGKASQVAYDIVVKARLENELDRHGLAATISTLASIVKIYQLENARINDLIQTLSAQELAKTAPPKPPRGW